MAETIRQFFAGIDIETTLVNIHEIIINLEPGAASTRYIIIGVVMISMGVLLALISVIAGKIKAHRKLRKAERSEGLTIESNASLTAKAYDAAEETVLFENASEETELLDDLNTASTIDDVSEEETELLEYSQGNRV